MPATSIQLHNKYGPLVRIGPYHVSVADSEALKVIYGADGRYHKVRSLFKITASKIATSDYQVSLDRILSNSPGPL